MASHAVAFNQNMDRDPTRTLTLRNKWVQDSNGRFQRLATDIRRAVGIQDVLGLKAKEPMALNSIRAATLGDARNGSHDPAPGNNPESPFINAEAPVPSQFQFRRDEEKVQAFMDWLRQAEKDDILEIVEGPTGPEPWTNLYVRSAYQRGLNDGLVRLRQAGIPVPDTTLGIAGIPDVTGAFYQPFHADRLQLIYRRTFSDLAGVTETMNTQIARVLTQGILEGIGPMEMAKRMTDRVDKIGMTRARLIARTETTETFNRAALGEYARAAAVIGKDIKVEWWTALDERVRSSHAARHGKIYDKDVAAGMLGEPNCRCSLLPVVDEG